MNDTSESQGDGKLSKMERKAQRREEKVRERERERRRNAKTRYMLWGSLVVLVAVIVGGAMLFTGEAGDGGEHGSGDASVLAVGDADWVRGNPEAAVTLVEYGDFQCPACASYHPIVTSLHEEFGDSVQFVYRHFPLRQIHPHAQIAGQAAEAAGRQGKFWEMHDFLFERQSNWVNAGNPEDSFAAYAGELGLDVDQFREELTADAARDAVNNGYESGLRAGVQGTPSFYLNGDELANPRSYDEFKQLVEDAINST